jgi:hypothetical protein
MEVGVHRFTWGLAGSAAARGNSHSGCSSALALRCPHVQSR